MKRSLLSTLFLFLSLICFAQNDHLTFAGIPINGTIDQFQKKLEAKGYTYDEDFSRNTPKGMRLFNGEMLNKKITVGVNYNVSSKIVYRVKVLFDELTEEQAKRIYNQIASLLIQKYETSYSVEGEEDGFPVTRICPMISDEQLYADDKYSHSLGEIQIYYDKNDSSYTTYPYIYTVHIGYIDRLNKLQNEQSLIDGL